MKTVAFTAGSIAGWLIGMTAYLLTNSLWVALPVAFAIGYGTPLALAWGANRGQS